MQICSEAGEIFVVQLKRYEDAVHLRALMENPDVCKIFHFARLDLAMIQHHLNCKMQNIYCTKVASKLARCNTERHSLGELCQFFLGKRLSKESQRSDWGAEELTPQQLSYAASDVLYLHELKKILDEWLVREGRVSLFQSICDFLPTCAALDVLPMDYRYLMEH